MKVVCQHTASWGMGGARGASALDYGGSHTSPDGLAFDYGGGVLSEARGDTQQRGWMSRRAFLSSSAAAGAATVAFGGTARAGTAPLDDVEAMVLQVAAAAAVFPIRFQTYESESASARLTAQRVARAKGRIASARAQQAERGAQAAARPQARGRRHQGAAHADRRRRRERHRAGARRPDGAGRRGGRDAGRPHRPGHRFPGEPLAPRAGDHEQTRRDARRGGLIDGRDGFKSRCAARPCRRARP